MNTKSNKFRTFYLSLFFVALYVPVLSVVLYSFNKSSSTAQWTGFTLDWYIQLLNDRVIFESFKISIQVAIITSVISAIIGTASAIISSYVSNKTESAINGVMFLPLIIPEVALGLSLLIFFSELNLTFGLPTLVLGHSLFCVPYIYFMVQLRLREIDISIIEAAKDLGASKCQIIKTVLLPLVIPSTLTGSLLAFAMSLDDVIISTYMAGPTGTTLPVHIFSMMRTGVTPKVNALSTLFLLGTFLLIGLNQIVGRKGENYYEE
ncbi:MAG: ABC transporter permease [Clostridiales bacterium]|nr:ABC transporter permease [Clostridiales bacterium]